MQIMAKCFVTPSFLKQNEMFYVNNLQWKHLLQLYFVDILEIPLLFCNNMSWKRNCCYHLGSELNSMALNHVESELIVKD